MLVCIKPLFYFLLDFSEELTSVTWTWGLESFLHILWKAADSEGVLGMEGALVQQCMSVSLKKTFVARPFLHLSMCGGNLKPLIIHKNHPLNIIQKPIVHWWYFRVLKESRLLPYTHV